MIPDLSKYEFFQDKEYELIPLKDGKVCRTFCMVTNGVKYLVRINDDFSPRSVKREVDTISYVKSYGGDSIMPKLYYYDEGYNVCVTEYYDGFIDLTKYTPEDQDYALISDYLKQIIKTMQEIKNPSEVSIYELAKKYIDCQTSNGLIEGILSEEQVQIINRFLESIEYFKTGKSTFIHNDISDANLMINPETKEIKLVDFEFAGLGDPLYDITHMILSVNNRYLCTFPDLEEFQKSDVFLFYKLYITLSHYRLDKRFKGIDRKELLEEAYAMIEEIGRRDTL